MAGYSTAAPTLTYITTVSSGTDATSYNFGNVTAASDGVIVCVAMARSGSNGEISTVSIGGTNGALHGGNTGANNFGVVATRAVSAGAHNITVTTSVTAVRCLVGVYLLTGYDSATPDDTDVGQSASATNRVLTLDYPSNGVGVYGAFHSNANANSWSSATENNEVFLESNGQFAVAQKSASGAGNTETVSWTSATNEFGIGAVWGDSTTPRDPLSASIPGVSRDPLTGTIPGL